jgi:hypothetical protein
VIVTLSLVLILIIAGDVYAEVVGGKALSEQAVSLAKDIVIGLLAMLATTRPDGTEDKVE